MGLLIARIRSKRKIVLFFAIIINLSILFIFKYLGFSCKIINYFLNAINIKSLTALNLVMPIGISFYTFQEISYLVDVYKNNEIVQKNFLNLGLYITFFPQLIAGPIVRYSDINEQILSRHFSILQVATGFERFIIGLSKKVLLANTFAIVCDSIYDADFFSYGAGTAWVAAFAYTLQIYYDFSGYSDMAIGLAKIFGFELLENFNYPYMASSISDFWKRWHISLTNFFRDYLYIPLGGNRRGEKRTVLNRFIVFFTTGLWHGAAFNFILWGLGHGIIMSIERKKNQKFSLVRKIWGHVYTLIALILLWVIFRNGTLTSLKLILKMFGINYSYFTAFSPIYFDELISPKVDMNFYIYAFLGVIFAFPWWRKLSLIKINPVLSNLLLVLKYLLLSILLILCYSSLAGNSYNPFIYFKF